MPRKGTEIEYIEVPDNNRNMNKSKLIAIIFFLALIAGACKPKDEDSGSKMKELADQFFLLEDTVWIDDAIFISPISTFEMIGAAKYQGFYFCIFRDEQIYEHRICKNRLLVFPKDGKEVKEVDLPYELKNDHYADLFVRHDTLFLKPYHCEQNGYYFDMELWELQPIELISDVIYEDNQYNVAYVDMGEWGAYTWFMEKPSETKAQVNQYIMAQYLSRIIKKDNVYYFIHGHKVDTLISLKGKAQLCENDHTYEAVVRDGYKYLYSLGSWKSEDSLTTTPVPTLFQFEGVDEDNWWDEKVYDTLFHNAFLTDNQLYYVVNTKESSYIAQLKDDKMHNVIDFGRRYDFFKWYGSRRGLNAAPNQCFMLFRENENSYGVMEIQDKLIHIRHVKHKQDTLPYIGTDNIEPLLTYLLNHLDHLTYTQVDEMEKSLQATCYGRFKELANDYFPAEYQTGKYKRINYYTVIDDKQMFTVSYCVNTSSSMVSGAFFDWDKNPKSDIGYNDYYELGLEKQKTEEVRRILTRLTGKNPVRKVGESTYLLWEYRNLTIKLYKEGRMVMYLTGRKDMETCRLQHTPHCATLMRG